MAQIINLQPKKETKPRKKFRQEKKLQSTIKWQAREFEYYSKDISWFMVSGLITLLLLIVAFFTKNFLLSILVILGYFTIIAYATKKPRKINFAITPRGVSINKTVYDFENLSSFWISYDPPQTNELSLRSRKKLMPYVKIPLANQNPVAIRAVLIQYIPEKKHKESSIDNLAKSLRF